MIRASIAGTSGYAGGELLRWLVRHEEVELVHLAGGEAAGRPVDEVWPSLDGLSSATLAETDGERLGTDSDIVFLALPAEASIPVARSALEAGARVVDLGAAFRLRDPESFRRWYGFRHPAGEMVAEAAYGLPELLGEYVRSARLVANPGCYPTAAVLALAPLVRERLLGGTVVVDAKSGVSGAGRGPSSRTAFGEVNENLRPYDVGRHRHAPELEQTLAALGPGAGRGRAGGTAAPESGTPPRDAGAPAVFFAPHLVPMTRGILASCYAPFARELSGEAALELYHDFYAAAPFVRVGAALPQTKATLGSNFCDVTVRVDPDRGVVTAIAAIDNLGKGAATQAIQNMNLMFGLSEKAGLWAAPVFP